ncbi:hypothetical protein FA15DRAFT_707069 [Coprinopsis marcescibilis]|uniref:Uncharacterized protein n=1 Tax=Coprinopsis marcescibilis TaxID=230819 RepID=A0A5C3KNF8_COPMA|nr:hypothetical protein FA15DRAFT_707069 [Coprinopsis marcescibilis]
MYFYLSPLFRARKLRAAASTSLKTRGSGQGEYVTAHRSATSHGHGGGGGSSNSSHGPKTPSSTAHVPLPLPHPHHTQLLHPPPHHLHGLRPNLNLNLKQSGGKNRNQQQNGDARTKAKKPFANVLIRNWRVGGGGREAQRRGDSPGGAEGEGGGSWAYGGVHVHSPGAVLELEEPYRPFVSRGGGGGGKGEEGRGGGKKNWNGVNSANTGFLLSPITPPPPAYVSYPSTPSPGCSGAGGSGRYDVHGQFVVGSGAGAAVEGGLFGGSANGSGSGNGNAGLSSGGTYTVGASPSSVRTGTSAEVYYARAHAGSPTPSSHDQYTMQSRSSSRCDYDAEMLTVPGMLGMGGLGTPRLRNVSAGSTSSTASTASSSSRLATLWGGSRVVKSVFGSQQVQMQHKYDLPGPSTPGSGMPETRESPFVIGPSPSPRQRAEMPQSSGHTVYQLNRPPQPQFQTREQVPVPVQNEYYLHAPSYPPVVPPPSSPVPRVPFPQRQQHPNQLNQNQNPYAHHLQSNPHPQNQNHTTQSSSYPHAQSPYAQAQPPTVHAAPSPKLPVSGTMFNASGSSSSLSHSVDGSLIYATPRGSAGGVGRGMGATAVLVAGFPAPPTHVGNGNRV